MDAIDVDGFPVPPGCEMFCNNGYGHWFFKIHDRWGCLVDGVNVHEPSGVLLYLIQSTGYRAWMDEAKKHGVRMNEQGRYVGDGDAHWKCIENAERCRGWRGK